MEERFKRYRNEYFRKYLLTYVLVPVAVLRADKETGRLPEKYWYLETHDNLGWEGLEEEPTIRKFTEKFGKRLGLMRWLLRNKLYALRYSWGIPYQAEVDVVSITEDETIVEYDGKYYFERKPSWKWGPIRYYARIGWKVWEWDGWGPEQSSQGMFAAVSPRFRFFE